MNRNLKLRLQALVLLFPLAIAVANAQANRSAFFLNAVQKIIDTSGAKVGVAVKGLDFEGEYFINGAQPFPMQSVYKFPQALAVLKRVDEGRLSLTQMVNVNRDSVDLRTWSPMLTDHPEHQFSLSLAEVLRYSAGQSDNNACDLLFKLTNGTKPVDNFVRNLGISGMAIVSTEAQMHRTVSLQYKNYSSPRAMAQLLMLFHQKKILSARSGAFLLQLMRESKSGLNRIKGLLPEGTVVAHKTGTSGTNARGISAATNDAGIVTLPNGRRYAIVVFVSDYKGDMAKGERIIAAISRLAWDYFTGK